MAAYRYCNASMLQSAELCDLETDLMIAIFWEVKPYSMPTLKTNLASPIIRVVEAGRFSLTSAFFSGRRRVTCWMAANCPVTAVSASDFTQKRMFPLEVGRIMLTQRTFRFC